VVRERILKAVLVVIGLLFAAAVYPMTMFFAKQPGLAMMLSVYATLGVFLLIASRRPSAHRSLIAFTAWSSLAHGGLMGAQAYRGVIERTELTGVAGFLVIGLALVALAPAPEAATAPAR